MPVDSDALTVVLRRHRRRSSEGRSARDFCRRSNQRSWRSFASETASVLAGRPAQIIWTPPFLRAFGGADAHPARAAGQGPRQLLRHHAATGVLDRRAGRDRCRARTTDDSAEDPDHPRGHARPLPPAGLVEPIESLAERSSARGVFAEGWAVYVTQVMMDVGYAADDPALMLAHWKHFLRACTNTLMDIRIHSGSMTEEEAMSMMVDGGFQERSEASESGAWPLSSTQLVLLLPRWAGTTELEREARRRAGNGFVCRPFLELVISHGRHRCRSSATSCSAEASHHRIHDLEGLPAATPRYRVRALIPNRCRCGRGKCRPIS